MIKSSDQSKNNSYRILKVLANQDYLAVDYQHLYYLFTPCQHPQSPLPSLSPNPYLLTSRQCITISHLHYYVFEVGSKNLQWGGAYDVSFKRNPITAFNLFKHAIQKVLYDLLWTDHREVVQYLTMNNFWVMEGELYLLLLKRSSRGVPLKRSEPKARHNSVPSKRSSTVTIISHELQTMRVFAIILWQVLHEQPWQQMKQDYNNSNFVSRMLALMITRSIPYEEIQQSIAEEEQKLMNANTKQMRITHKQKKKTFTVPVIRQEEERRSLTSPKLTHTPTEPIPTNQPSILQPVILFNRPHRHQRIFLLPKKSTSSSVKSQSSGHKSSLDRTHRRKSIPSRQSFSEAIRHTAWRHSTLSALEEKIRKQKYQARERFNNSVLHARNEPPSQPTADEALRSRLMAKMQRYKQQKQKEKELLNSKMQTLLQPNILSAMKTFHQPESDVLPVQSIIQAQEMPQSKTKISSIENKEVLQNVKEGLDQSTSKIQGKVVAETDFKRLPKMTEGKLVQQDDSEIEEISFNRQSRAKIISKPEQQQRDRTQFPRKLLMAYRQLEIPKNDPPSAFESLQKTVNAGSLAQEFLTMLNIIGDISIKAIRGKATLEGISWKKIIFFLYERFYFERNQWLVRLEKSQPMPVRKTPDPSLEDWQKWHSGKEKAAMLKAIRSENPVIGETLARLAGRVLQEGGLEKKVEYFVRNREELQSKLSTSMRRQISKILIIYLINDFDGVTERKQKPAAVLNFLRDSLFGARIIAELDGLLPPEKYVELSRYREEAATMERMAKQVDTIYDLYFPESPLGQSS